MTTPPERTPPVPVPSVGADATPRALVPAARTPPSPEKIDIIPIKWYSYGLFGAIFAPLHIQ